MAWRIIGGGVAIIICGLYALGWLTVEGSERRTYGYVAVAAGALAYWLVP